MSHRRDVRILRELATQYAEAAADPRQDELRVLWTRHNSLQETRPLVRASYGMWNVWCREVFGDAAMQCEEPFYRDHERYLRMQLFQHTVGDDTILEPWIPQPATKDGAWGHLWGVPEIFHLSEMEGGAWQFDPQIKTWADRAKMSVVHHRVDEEATRANVARLQDAIGDILEVDVVRGSAYDGAMADISTSLARLRGLEQMMEDMYDAPEQLHEMLAYMRDGILTVQQEAEDAGAYSLTTQHNQSMTYCEKIEAPRANSGPRKRQELWAQFSAQEYTLISPAMHDEFLLRYQLPIMQHWGLISYGCCEDLTHKIDMLRQIHNLRSISVTPVADVAKSAEQIGPDYVFSWRPNPTDMVCCSFIEEKIREIISDGLLATRANDCRVHIHLKDIETVEGHPERLPQWVRIVRDVIEKYW